jgi:PAS domain-containing protein
VLFLLFDLIGGEDEAASDSGEQNTTAPRSISKEIVVSQGRIESLVALYKKTWQRPPTKKELGALIDAFIREEIMYRQALALGLDRDDAMVRRRMKQKLEFFTEDIADLAEPTDAGLEEYLATHPDSYRLDPKFTFRQVYLNAKRRGEALDSDVKALLAELRTAGEAANISEAGDPLLLDPSYRAISQRDVAKMFGQEFSDSLLEVEPGNWQGPIRSGFGVHLVFVRERIDGRLPELDEVRAAVARDWSSTMRNESNEALFDKWRSQYTVTIEQPDEKAGGEPE